MENEKKYKPGQVITITTPILGRKTYRICKTNSWCKDCDCRAEFPLLKQLHIRQKFLHCDYKECCDKLPFNCNLKLINNEKQ